MPDHAPERAPFGSTGLTVTRIGLGLAALGRPAYLTLGRAEDLGDDRSPPAMEARCHELLDTAYAAGVRYVDAARSYGSAEAFLASWLARRHRAPAAVTVGSKWGYRYVGGWDMDARVHEVKDHSLGAFERQRDETLALLGRHLSLYQVHSATLESGVLEDHAVLGALAAFAATGVTVGLSVSGPAQGEVVRRALDVEVDGVRPFHSVQATWNLLEPSVGPALARASAAGWGVIVKEAVANGRLTTHGDGAADPVLAGLAAAHHATIDQLALAAALAASSADVVLSGAVTTRQLHSNLEALRLDLTPDELARLGALAEPPERYWAERSGLAWG